MLLKENISAITSPGAWEESHPYGLRTILGQPEVEWFHGETFQLNNSLMQWHSPRYHRACDGNDPLFESSPTFEIKALKCLRWPQRALSAMGSCPGGSGDLEPATTCGNDRCKYGVIRLPQCRSYTERLLKKRCLVYSFGIGGDLGWENYMATKHGCQVHAFDPTRRLRAQHASMDKSGTHGEAPLRPVGRHGRGKVFFHFAGVTGSAAVTSERDNSGRDRHNTSGGMYGTIDTTVLKTLPEFLQMLGHSDIDVLKVDCEGCEWTAIVDALPLSLKGSIKQLFVEVHIADNFVVPSVPEYHRFWTHLLRDFGFRLTYRHDNIGENGLSYASYANGKSGGNGARTPAYLREVGVPDHQCCIEYAFVQPSALLNE